jgi:GAF domain-containing protein/class 3 adenylate cyclase
MMSRHFEKLKARRQTAPPKRRNGSKIQRRISEAATCAKALDEARRQQSALAEVLSAISGSKFELQPVLDRVVRTAARLCRARKAVIFRFEDGIYRFVAGYSISPAYLEIERRSKISPGPGTLVGRVATVRCAVRIDDAWSDPLYERKEDAKVGKLRSMLGVPLLRDGEPIGVIGLSRSRVDPFSDRDVELVTTFANQAVIAIENVRLFEAEQLRTRELTESLEQQKAAAEVLQVISRSQGELEPVFATMLEKAVRICSATFGNIYRWDGELLHIVATHKTPAAFAEERRRLPYRPDQNSPVGRMVATKTPMHIRDVMAEDAYLARRDSGAVAAVELGGARTVLSVPLINKGEMTGAFFLCRQRVQPFTDKQVKVVQNFATQAVIATENVRLLNELRERTADLTEALGQQKAITGVLQMLSGSSGNLESIFQVILESAVNICQAHFGNLFLYEDGAFRGVAMFNAPEAYVRARMRAPFTRPRESGLGRLATTKDVVQIVDLLAEDIYLKGDPFAIEGAELAGIRTLLAVPMLKDDQIVGCIIIYRQEPRPFSEKQIQLVKNFASQVVLGLENARLLNELRERTCELERSYTLVQRQAVQLDVQAHELKKLNEGLEERVSEQVSEIERMSRLRRFLPPQVADLIVTSGMEWQLESHRREITALFCDLRGFTGFTERADAAKVMALLRDYHAAIGEIITRYSGTLERYAGDGVMVVFNDPVAVENPELQAVLMALEMRDAIGVLTEKRRRCGYDVSFGIGIEHGFATLGTIGFEGRFDYAAIGTVSNVASRLCDQALPGQILISSRVRMAVEDIVKAELVGEFAIKGIRQPMLAYDVLAKSGM